MAAPARLLLVGVNWLGDALMLTPAVRAVRRAYPNAHIEILVPHRVRGVFARNPHLNGVRVYDDRAPILSPAFWATAASLRQARFDTAILFHASTTKARLARWAGIAQRWGLSGGGRDALLTRTAPAPSPGRHRAQIYLDLVAAFGIPPDGSKLDFVPDPDAQRAVDALLGQSPAARGPFAAVHGGGNWGLKRWPVSHFRQWVKIFLERSSSAGVVLCGSASEEPVAREIAEGFDPARVAVLTGRTGLDELAWIFRKAQVVLSNDSGPIHLAASQGARIVGLYGPTSPAQTGPWTEAPSQILWKDPGCEIPCYFRSCDLRVCLERLTPEEVLRACERVTAS